MTLDHDKIDEAVLALLQLGLHDEVRVWKTFDWDAMDRLHAKGLISDPVGKTKSVVLTERGMAESDRLLMELFGKRDEMAEPKEKQQSSPPRPPATDRTAG